MQRITKLLLLAVASAATGAVAYAAKVGMENDDVWVDANKGTVISSVEDKTDHDDDHDKKD